MIFRRLAVAAVVVALLSSCAGPPDGDLVFGAPTFGPTPEPMISRGCDGLVPDRAFEVPYGRMLEQVDPALLESASEPGIPEAILIRAAGGLACEWIDSTTGSDARVWLAVLPDTATEWLSYAEATGVAGIDEDWCYLEAPVECGSRSLIRGMWVESVAIGAESTEGAVALTNMLAHSVLDVSATGSRWAGVDGPRDECDSLLDDVAVSAALQRDAEIYREILGESLSPTAGTLVGYTECGINERDMALATLDVLPGGAWAWEQVRNQPSREPIVIAGADAVIQCNSGCVVDINADGNWVRIGTHPDLDDPSGAAIALATAIVELPR